MNAVPPSMAPGLADFGQSDASGRWIALQDAANIVAVLAGLEAERPASEIRNFPALMREAPEWCGELVDRGIEDMAAVMEHGIAALLSVTARDTDPRAAALALWHEFTAARAAMLALLPPNGTMEPHSDA